MTRSGAAVLPVLSGLLLAFSYPPFPLAPVVFVGLVPLLLHIVERPAGAAGRWEATRGGITTGVVYFGIQLYWMASALLRYSLLAIPAYVGAVLVLAGLLGGFAWALHLTRERLRLPLPLLAAIFWTTAEWTQGHLGDLAFPWLGLGTALAPLPTLAAAADLVGARGLTFWVAAVNGIVTTIILRYRVGRPARRLVIVLVAAVLLPAGYGAARNATLETRPAARVAVVQPSIPEDVKLGPMGLDSSLAVLSRLTASLEGEPLDLVAWPEVALPADFQQSPLLREAVQELTERVDAPILVGAYGVDHAHAAHNSAFLVERSRRAVPAPRRYDKRRMVPFVERVPFVGPRRLASGVVGAVRIGDLRRGDSGDPLPLSGEAFGTLICFESAFAPLARSYRRDGATFLVNITNDAWYGRDTRFGRTTALWQHPAHLVLRAIETRTGVVRAANTGISMFIDPLGRTHQRTTLFEPAIAIATVQTADTTTLFTRWGDWLASLAVLAAMITIGLAYEDRRRRG